MGLYLSITYDGQNEPIEDGGKMTCSTEDTGKVGPASGTETARSPTVAISASQGCEYSKRGRVELSWAGT